MLSQEIRRKFLQFFKERGHATVPSSSVVPHDDPTLLFTNAGMNQFKDVFLGKSKRDYTRAVTAQKCIRVGGKHNDLDNVGHTARHLTFFEMLGNFSFGNYFKKEAILYAWEVATQVFGFAEEKIWITIFREDDEAFEYWKAIVPEKRIVRMDEKDNFWEMGETGPCGPCSELYYDKGEKYGSATSIKEDVTGERYLEFWNLVFMQYHKDHAGQCQPLPKQSIDTGAGLERILSLKIGADSVFATDVLRALIAQVETLCAKRYDPMDLHFAPAFHVIADHVRSLAFAIADGAQPSNVERGYILRKLLRRAVRYGRMLGLQEPFLARVLPALIKTMGEDFSELSSASTRIAEILTLEEEAFLRTLKRGGNILSQVIEKAEQSPHKQIAGEEAFKLKDTYGLPIEEILLIAKDTGLSVNLEAYQLLEAQAKERSRTAQTLHSQTLEKNIFEDYAQSQSPTLFVGYDKIDCPATIRAILYNGEFVTNLSKGQEGVILLDTTPFYAEKGGQVGDLGMITHGTHCFQVTQCHSPYPGVIAHKGWMETGTLHLKETVVAKIDTKRRQQIANNHTATHLLHWGLQQVLGPHIRQAGSLVEPTRLRFDFNHHKALTKQEMRCIETLINEKVRQGHHVNAYEISYEEAQHHPDIKQFFGDKYGTTVRVIDIEYSKELCGGTHTDNVSTIGYFRIVEEGSIAAGVRRIEAVTGKDAEEFAYLQEDLMDQMATLLKTSPAKVHERVEKLLEENKASTYELKHLKLEGLKTLASHLTHAVQKVGNYPFLAKIVSVDAPLLPELLDMLMHALHSGVILLAIQGEGRCQVMIKVSPDWVAHGLFASNLLKEILPFFAGKGGGKKEIAQAGGTNPEGLPLAFERAISWLAAQT